MTEFTRYQKVLYHGAEAYIDTVIPNVKYLIRFEDGSTTTVYESDLVARPEKTPETTENEWENDGGSS